MKVTACLNNLRISPRKVSLVIDNVRGIRVEEALVILNYDLRKSSDVVLKLLKSALANAENTYKLKVDNLFISEISVNESKTLKRWMPRAYGRAYQILKRTSNIKVVLSELIHNEDNN